MEEAADESAPVRRRPGPRPRMDAETITAAAIEIADADGLAAVSMANVAKRLGFTTMSLYRHVAGKDELLERMIDAGVGAPGALDEAGWREGLAQWTTRILDRAVERPWVLDVPILAPPRGPNSLAWMDQALAAMQDLPLPGADRVGVVLVLNNFAMSEAAMITGLRRGAARYGGADAPAYGDALRSVVDPVQFPALHHVLESGALDVPVSATPEEELDDFRFGLDLVLDGIEALIARAGQG